MIKNLLFTNGVSIRSKLIAKIQSKIDHKTAWIVQYKIYSILAHTSGIERVQDIMKNYVDTIRL